MVETSLERRGLAEIAAQPHNNDALIIPRDLGKQAVGAVLAAVIDKHNLKRLADGIHHVNDLDVELRDCFFLIEERNNDCVGN
jgi:hypothetical protein